ncbi:hypothetical protein ACSNOK_26160 [Streptomyces sp. URMC 126]|uniref:hypothetical protein n=1 Tax=Streptomyces sp. URMC 126 TaxID=3423401 RepID=UPI003F1E4420
MPADRPTMPPVRLLPDAELARDALSAPLFARAARLARWAGEGTPVGAGGELLADQLRAATGLLGLDGEEDGPAHTAEAWQLALDTGLVEFTEDEKAGDDAGRSSDEPCGTAVAGEELATLTSGSPQDVLDVWLGGLETVLADAAAPDLGDIVDQLSDGGDLDLDAIDWNPEEEADFLDGVLGNLYLLTALDPNDPADDAAARRPVPLPALAASLIVPDDMDEPTDDVLEEVSDAMMRLDDQFRLLAPTGLIEYQPVDEALIEEVDGEGHIRESVDGVTSDVPEEEDVTRYGMVSLTPLGVFAVRTRMLEAGVDAPAVGDLAEKDAAALLAALPHHPRSAARAETELWLARRDPLTAARELLAAARGDDTDAPLRRLACQQALALMPRDAEPAFREVLDDPELGGLARVWLAERGAADIPEPGETMVFWLTIDTIAAQLASEGDSEELRELVIGLVGQHSGFFDSAWRVEHPATADVLEAMGRLHPEKKVAKAARKAAFKARSRG